MKNKRITTTIRASYRFSIFILCVSICFSIQTYSDAPPPLWKKAEIFQHDMEQRFLLEGQALCKLILPRENRELSYNMPDNAYMTGIYVATLAMKYLCTQEDKDKQSLIRSIQALHLLNRCSGKSGLLARAVIPIDSPWKDDGIWRVSADGKYCWRGDVSSDQVDGVMFGYSWAYQAISDESIRTEIAKDVTAIVEHIIANDLRIVDVDGKPTTWGKYFPAYTHIEPLNALLWLQALKVVHQVTGDTKYDGLYRYYALEKQYAERATRARINLDPTRKGWVNHSDDVLFFLGIEPLLRLETDPDLRAFYIRSLKNAWEGTPPYPGLKPEANPLYTFLATHYLNDQTELENAKNTLRWFTFTIKWNNDTLQRYEQHWGMPLTWPVQSPEPEPGKPIPIDRREKTWSAWVQDPYHSAGDPRAFSRLEYNGHDYLLAYWFGRHLGYIKHNE